MALIDDLQINLPNQRLNINATLFTVYQCVDFYSLLQNLFDEIGAIALAGSIAYPTPLTASTKTDYTLVQGWYLTQASYRFLQGGSIQTSGFANTIYLLTLASGGYTSAITGDLYKTVVGGTSTATGRLLDYDNTARKWWVRRVTGTYANSEAITITTGTGAGSTIASTGSQTGEEGSANAYTLGTLNHGGTYFAQGSTVTDGTGWYGNSNITGNHIDILIKVREAGNLISSGSVTFFNRTNRDAANALDGATVGDTYDWYNADLSGFGRTPIPLNTKADLADTLTNAQALNLTNGTTATIALTIGSFTADVDQDGSTESYTGRVDQSSQTNAVLYSVLKYIFRKGNTTTINSVQAQLFQFLNSAYTVVKDSPIAAIAGGKIFYARGWYPINVVSSDASNYQTIGTGSTTPINPPVFYLRARTGVPVGAKVILARSSSSNFLLTSEFALAAGNNSGNGTLVLSAAIPLDKPSSGFVRVFDNSGNEDRYAYTSFSGATLTLSGTLSKTYAAANAAYIPYLDTTAGSSTVSVALRYVADRSVASFVRLGSGASKIQGDSSNYTLTAADSSVPVTAIADTINNN
jgi:hypothetical protein